MKILIINLTRFGDILQTQPLISAYASQGHDVAFLCLESFVGAAELLAHVKHIYTLADHEIADTSHSWPENLGIVHALVRDVQSGFTPDRVINVTPSIPARLLTKLFGVDDSMGFVVDEFGFQADTSPWATFVQQASGYREQSPFNICDLYVKLGKRADDLVGECAYPEFFLASAGGVELKAAKALVRKLSGSSQDTPFICLQLGASDDFRRWPVDYFRSLAVGLQQKGYTVVLLGTESEAVLGQRLNKDIAVSCVDLMGKTNLPLLRGILSLCKGLVSNDTGTMHLAAGLGTPVLGLFLATAQPWDTAPYLEGALCLEPDIQCHPCSFKTACDHNSCRNALSVEDVLQCSLSLFAQEPLGDVSTARVWQCRRDEHGFMGLKSLSNHEHSDRTQWLQVQRHHYRHFFDGEVENCPCLSDVGNADGEKSSLFNGELKQVVEKITMLLMLLEKQGAALGVDPVPAIRRKFLLHWQMVQNELQGFEKTVVLGAMWGQESQRAGGDLSQLMVLIGRYKKFFNGLLRCL
ncbi:MAG: glycosyltransferase family 9 protein [Desulfovibrio sp.]